MNRLAYIAGRNLRYSAARILPTTHTRLGALYPAHGRHGVNTEWLGRYSTKASELRSQLPKLWIAKMKTAFACLDSDGDGYITGKDFELYEKEIARLFPDMTQEQRESLATNVKSFWNDIVGAKGRGPEYKVTEDIFIENFFQMTLIEGNEDVVRKEWGRLFTAFDTDKDGVISKAEHSRFFQSLKNPVAAIVAFTAIDENLDGVISRDEFTKAGTEFFFNFTDETKPSNYMYGPLKS